MKLVNETFSCDSESFERNFLIESAMMKVIKIVQEKIINYLKIVLLVRMFFNV